MGSEHGPLLKHGRKKRNDCLFVTLALVLDGSGFPRKAKIYPGNAREPHTLKQAIDQTNLTVIMDAGIATEENLTYLRNKGFDWLCGVKRRQCQRKSLTKRFKRRQTQGYAPGHLG